MSLPKLNPILKQTRLHKPSAECKRKSNGNTKPKCANCGGDHSGKYRGCPKTPRPKPMTEGPSPPRPSSPPSKAVKPCSVEPGKSFAAVAANVARSSPSAAPIVSQPLIQAQPQSTSPLDQVLAIPASMQEQFAINNSQLARAIPLLAASAVSQ
ncbi:uncharacterized protein LOC126266380 [Aethina tumida]|uniref:uncharacterized protein LOC126266380 n=1 Tax=Aethina tumida TaxID=116153 RepID=UPI0021487B31|nr:uncharacterized protein LOC126266380 [Aethina tumida]